MRLIWNLLAILGLLVLVGVIVVIVQLKPPLNALSDFDDQVANTYLTMAERLLKTGNGAEATSVKVAVEDGLSPEDVEQTMRIVANEHNIKNVGELPLYKEVEAVTGEPYRFVKIYMFCNAMTAARMLDYSDAFSAYLPCRITLVEDPQGKLWLYTLNMDLMIHGGKELPPALKEEAMQVKHIIEDIMNRGAKGDF